MKKLVKIHEISVLDPLILRDPMSAGGVPTL